MKAAGNAMRWPHTSTATAALQLFPSAGTSPTFALHWHRHAAIASEIAAALKVARAWARIV